MKRGRRLKNVMVRLNEREYHMLLEIKRNLGIEHDAEAVRSIIRNMYQQVSKSLEKGPRLEHINTYKNRVTILDRELEGHGRVIDVVFLEEKNELEKIIYPYCTYCQTNDCLHADYAFEIPDVREILRKHGIKKRMRGREIEDF